MNEKDLIEKASHLSQLLKGQFLLHPPCVQLDKAIKHTVDELKAEFMISNEAVSFEIAICTASVICSSTESPCCKYRQDRIVVKTKIRRGSDPLAVENDF